MNRTLVSGRAGLGAVVLALVLAHGVAAAQTKVKPPPRLQPTPSQTTQIPAGIDSGSPASSDTMQLGTPVPGGMGTEGKEYKAHSAAARAAARPKPGASSADCVQPAAKTAVPAGTPASASGPRVWPAGAASGASPQTAVRPPGC